MNRKHIVIALLIMLAVAGLSAYLLRPPAFSAEDFVNEEPQVSDPTLPQSELDIRRLELLEKEPPREGEDPDEALLDAIEDYTTGGLYDEALRVVDSAEGQIRETPLFLSLQGDLFVAMRQYKSAVESYDKALDAGADKASLYLKLGNLYLEHSQVRQKSVALYKKAHDLIVDPTVRRNLEVKIKILEKSF